MAVPDGFTHTGDPNHVLNSFSAMDLTPSESLYFNHLGRLPPSIDVSASDILVSQHTGKLTPKLRAILRTLERTEGGLKIGADSSSNGLLRTLYAPTNGYFTGKPKFSIRKVYRTSALCKAVDVMDELNKKGRFERYRYLDERSSDVSDRDKSHIIMGTRKENREFIYVANKKAFGDFGYVEDTLLKGYELVESKNDKIKGIDVKRKKYQTYAGSFFGLWDCHHDYISYFFELNDVMVAMMNFSEVTEDETELRNISGRLIDKIKG